MTRLPSAMAGFAPPKAAAASIEAPSPAAAASTPALAAARRWVRTGFTSGVRCTPEIGLVYESTNLSAAASRTQTTTACIASVSSASSGNVGASRMLRSCESSPYG